MRTALFHSDPWTRESPSNDLVGIGADRGYSAVGFGCCASEGLGDATDRFQPRVTLSAMGPVVTLGDAGATLDAATDGAAVEPTHRVYVDIGTRSEVPLSGDDERATVAELQRRLPGKVVVTDYATEASAAGGGDIGANTLLRYRFRVDAALDRVSPRTVAAHLKQIVEQQSQFLAAGARVLDKGFETLGTVVGGALAKVTGPIWSQNKGLIIGAAALAGLYFASQAGILRGLGRKVGA